MPRSASRPANTETMPGAAPAMQSTPRLIWSAVLIAVRFTFTPSRDTSVEEVNGVLKAASETNRLRGILEYSEDPLVSVDIVHTSASSTVDSLETAVLEGKLVRVVSWYDNEWGFSNRMVDTAGAIAKLI